VGEGKHLRFRVRQQGRDAGSVIAFGLGPQADRIHGGVRYDLACRLKENRWNGASSPQLVLRRLFDAPERYEALRTWLGEQWRAGAAAWTPEARSIFAELRLEGATGKRQLLESSAFRALLAGGLDSDLRRAA
jgi:hypothetical protein